MSETTSTPSSNNSQVLSEGNATLLKSITEQLDADTTRLEVYEGEHTGRLYVETETGYRYASMTATGLQTATTTTVDEPLDPLVRIEPDESEVPEEADVVNTLSTGGD